MVLDNPLLFLCHLAVKDEGVRVLSGVFPGLEDTGKSGPPLPVLLVFQEPGRHGSQTSVDEGVIANL